METHENTALLLLGQPSELPQLQLPTNSDVIRLYFLRHNEYLKNHEKISCKDKKVVKRNIIGCSLTSGDSRLKCIGKYKSLI